jgi:hypothetical protein
VALDNLKNEYEAQKIIDQSLAKTEKDRLEKEYLEVKRSEETLFKSNQDLTVKLDSAATWVNNRVEEVQKQLQTTNQVTLRVVEQNLKDKEDHLNEILAKQKNIPQQISDFFKGFFPSFDKQIRDRLRGDPSLDIKDISVIIESQLNQSRDEGLEVFLSDFSFKLSPEQINDISKTFKDTWRVSFSQFLTQTETTFVEFRGTSQLNKERELNQKLIEQQTMLDNTLKQKQEEITVKTQDLETVKMITAQINNIGIYDTIFSKKIENLVKSLSKNDLLKFHPESMYGARVKEIFTKEKMSKNGPSITTNVLAKEVANYLKKNNAGTGIPRINDIIDSLIVGNKTYIMGQFWDIMNSYLQGPVVKIWDEKNRVQLEQIEQKAENRVKQVEQQAIQTKEELIAAEHLIDLGRANYEEVANILQQEIAEREELLQRIPLETKVERPPLETQPAPIERKQPPIQLVPQKKTKREQRVEGIDEKTGKIVNPTQKQIIMEKAEQSVREKLKRGREENRKDPNTRPRQRSRSTSEPRVEKSIVTIHDKAEWIDNDGYKQDSEIPIDKMSQQELEGILNEIQGAKGQMLSTGRATPRDKTLMKSSLKSIQEQLHHLASQRQEFPLQVDDDY